ncbi:MAG: hypothetical protein QM599_07350 [Pseudoxanthomonas sp.]
MSKLLRFTGWLLLTALVVWALVIVFWRVAGIHPEARDLVLYLGVLPLGTFAVLRYGLNGARKKKASGTRGETEQSIAGRANGGDEAPHAEPAPRIAILASALQLPVGGDPASALESLAAPIAPKLHDKLKDGSGFPIFASWARDTDTATAEQALEALDAHADAPPAHFDEEQLRALALLIPVTQDLLQRVVSEAWLAGPEPTAPQGVHRGAASPLPGLRATVFLPADWPAAVRERVSRWLSHEADACGIPGDQLTVEVLPASAAGEPWQHVAAIGASPEPPAAPPTLHLLLACHSLIGERSVQRLGQSGQLYSARQPEGIVPGEAAAGILLLAADHDDRFAFQPRAILRASATVRQGVSWQPRAAMGQMEDLFGQTLACAPEARQKDLKALVSDADFRKSRSTAVAGFFDAALAHLEPEGNCVTTGCGCGHAGIASPLVLIALAAEKASAAAGAVLALAVAEPDQRSIALVLPPDPPPSGDAAIPPGNTQAT